MRPFPELLSHHLSRCGFTQTSFATKVGVGTTTVSNAILGLRVPRWDRHDAWCDALDLAGQEREDFLDAWGIALAPPRIAALVSRLEKAAKRK
jgi:hypothetical protein